MKVLNSSDFDIRLKKLLRWIFPTLLVIRESILLLKHELWRDELQAWLISFNSSNPLKLMSNLKYEGRPPLWHFLLWALTRFSNNPESMKILTGIIFTATIFIFFALKSFSLFEKLAISGGFYFAFGYSVVSRDYNLLLLLVVLLLFLREMSYSQSYQYLICIALALVNPFGAVLALAWLLAEGNQKFLKLDRFYFLKPKFILSTLPIFMILLIFKMPSDAIFKPNLAMNPKKIIGAFLTSFVKPFLPFNDQHIFNLTDLIKGILILGLLALIFIYSNYAIKISITFSMVLVMANALVGYSLYWWHFGTVFLLFLASISINRISESSHNEKNLKKAAIWILLIIQITGSVWGIGKDFSDRKVYSNIRLAGEYLNQEFPGYSVVSNSEIFATPLYGYIKPTKIYFPGIKQYAYFTSWKEANLKVPTEKELVEASLRLRKSVIVTSYFPKIKDSRVRLVKQFENAVWGDNFQIYEIVKANKGDLK